MLNGRSDGSPWHLALAYTLAFATACASTSEPGTKSTQLRVEPATAALLVGDVPFSLRSTSPVSGVVCDAGMCPTVTDWNPVAASWTSSSPQVVSVNASGAVTGLAPGQATVTATRDGVKATATIYVLRYQPALDFVQLSTTGYDLCGRTSDSRVLCMMLLLIYPDTPKLGPFGTSQPADVCKEKGGLLLDDVIYGPCSHIPLEVDGAHRFVSVAVGGFPRARACGVDTDGATWCWGTQPARQAQLPPLKMVTLGGHPYLGDFCGLDTSGQPLCWTVDSAATRFTAGAPLDSLVGDGSTACGLDATGVAWCWGANGSGLLGDSTTSDRLTPEPVHTTVRFKQLALSGAAACGLDTTGQAYCWGASIALVPTAAPISTSFRSIAISGSIMCGIDAAGAMTCWDATAGAPSIKPGPAGVWAKVFGGGRHMCAVETNGHTECWVPQFNGAFQDIPRGG